ncbi:MAG: nucleotidyltransferase family protein [Kangiellaceae bacterium]|nr:nucleotidyltransferase family protein [Kangiellaceae bacterium]
MYEKKLIELITSDPKRVEILNILSGVSLVDCYVAAGFVRNCVWDHLHGFEATALNDIDVIFFDKDPRLEKQISDFLYSLHPGINWQVKNQAFMHLKNGDPSYRDIVDAMSYWPEKETAVAVRLSQDKSLDLIYAFNLDSLFAGEISHNEKRDFYLFKSRINKKGWLNIWPQLKINSTI